MKIDHQKRKVIQHPDVLLINPPDDFARYPYLGLSQMASVLRERNIMVDILDSAAMKLDLHGIVQYVKTVKPRIIGISIMSMMLRFSYNLIEALCVDYPDGVIVVGGAHLDADPDIIKHMNVSYGFRGEVEYSFASFCESILGGLKPDNLPGLITKNGQEIIKQPPAIIEDLNILPRPAYDLLPIGSYYTPSSASTAISYISSRGCPYNCNYCSKLQQKKYRHLNAERIVDDLEYLTRELGVRWIEFVDEIFTLKKEHILDLCRLIVERKIKIKWGMGTRIDRLDEELLLAMKAAGLEKIGFGLEAGEEKIRFSTNKRIENKMIEDVINMCAKHHIITIGSFILGLPGETESDIHKTIFYARQLNLNYAYFNRLIPIPNSEIFASMVETGKILPDVWTLFMKGEVQHPLCKPDDISENRMQQLFRKAWWSAFFDIRKIWRNRLLLLNLEHLTKSFLGFLKLASPKRYKK